MREAGGQVAGRAAGGRGAPASQVRGGSAYSYELDPSFDLSRREAWRPCWPGAGGEPGAESGFCRQAQLAIVEFCQRLRREAELKAGTHSEKSGHRSFRKVVKGQWSCWPSKLKADTLP